MITNIGTLVNFTLFKGIDYLYTHGTHFLIAFDQWPAITGGTLTLTTSWGLSKSAVILDSVSTTKTIYFELTAAETQKILPEMYSYEIICTLSSHTLMLVTGLLDILERP